jgi:hypothetical protein
MDAEELVMVPVPRSLLSSVYRLLAREMNPTEAPEGPSTDGNAATRDRSPAPLYSEDDFQRLKRLPLSEPVRLLLDTVSKDPNQRISFEEFCQLTGRTRGQGRADLAGFTKLIGKQFGLNRWPIDAIWDASAEHYVYQALSPEAAVWWNSA